MYLCCKFGKVATLLPAAANRMQPDCVPVDVDEEASTLAYWLRASCEPALPSVGSTLPGAQSPPLAAVSAAGGAGSPPRRVAGDGVAPEVRVQAGSSAWEAALWRLSFVTDSLHP